MTFTPTPAYSLEPATETLRKLQLAGDTRVIVEPKDDELFIDLDSDSDSDQLTSAIATLRRNGEPVEIVRDDPSRTPGHRHVVLRMGRDLTPTERVCLQACLGSDRKRELLAVLRIWNSVPPVTVFFEEAELGKSNE